MKWIVFVCVTVPLLIHLIIAYNPPQTVRLWAVNNDYAHYCFKEVNDGMNVDTYFVWGENPFDKSDIPPCL